MKLGSDIIIPSKKALMLLSVATLFLSFANIALLSGSTRNRKAVFHALPSAGRVLWHAGTFRYLEATADNFLEFVGRLSHPIDGAYGKLSSTRTVNFNLFLDALFAAIDAGLVDGNAGDWCEVKAEAAAAGYAIRRFYDTETGRWFIYAYDTTPFGQAYFFINPFAKRNIVIEVPHEPDDYGTKMQGAQLFMALAARALIINKERRCSDPDASGCDGNTRVCSSDGSLAPARESDVAHQTANTFHLLHVRYTDMDTATSFVQLHGFGSSSGHKAEIADVTTNDRPDSSVSVIFANHLRKYVPDGEAVHSCQEYDDGSPPSGLCATKNMQGRYTNNPDGDTCLSSTSSYSGRFLHIEQARTLRDDDDSDGWHWGDIRDALLETWPDCNMNNGATDCTLGPRQTEYEPWTCP